MDTPLSKRKCVACEGEAEPLPESAAKALLSDVPRWVLLDGKIIRREITCSDFIEAVSLIQNIAVIAESEGHHPDFHLTRYKHLRIDLSTHAISGLSENDFILAAKIDELLNK